MTFLLSLALKFLWFLCENRDQTKTVGSTMGQRTKDSTRPMIIIFVA